MNNKIGKEENTLDILTDNQKSAEGQKLQHKI